MDEVTAAYQQDQQRTGRLFLAAIGSAMGINDQSYLGQDSYAVNFPGQYQTIGMNGAIGVEGRPISNAQRTGTVAGIPVGLLLVIGLVFLLKKA
jgi:hypothetical protein